MKSFFSAEELKRYGRQLILPEIGLDGQKKLKDASVLVVGAGGLGSPTLLYLAAAGVGTLGIVDQDVVDESNLHRQVIHGASSVGKSKLASAQETLQEINPHIHLKLHETRLTSRNALEILKAYDVIVDGTDNFATRYLLNDACGWLKKPLVYGSVFRFEGQVSVFDSQNGPCYRCLFAEPPPPHLVPNCAESGVLGVLPGIIGTLQCNEALKLILGIGSSLRGVLLSVNALTMEIRRLKFKKRPDCALCSPGATIKTFIDYEAFCQTSIQEEKAALTPTELKTRWDKGDKIQLVDVREPFEVEIASIGGIHIPLGELPTRLSEIDQNQEIVMLCHHGVRSARAAHFLKEQGFQKVWNLSGGIDRWSLEVDSKIPRY